MKNYQKNFFIKNGYLKIKLDNKKFFHIDKKLRDILKKKLNFKDVNLEKFHTNISINKLNNIRLYVFKKINEDKKFRENLYYSAKKNIDEMVGNELCCSDINLSIQLPKDTSSLLEMHSDFFSGESLFQINLWVPFVNVKKTQSMFIIDPINSLKILKKIKHDPKIDFNKIHKHYKNKLKWISLKKGEAILFSPNCLHGNVINQEKKTRWSINIRYKNIFSPEIKVKNEKKIGSYYNLLNPKAVTLFNLNYDFDEITI